MRKCKMCGASIDHKRRDAKWCSTNCASRADYSRNREERRHKANEKKRRAGGWPELTGRECKFCGEGFDAHHARQTHCSSSCRNRASWHKNRHKRAIGFREYQILNRRRLTEYARSSRRANASAQAVVSAMQIAREFGV